MTEFGKYGTGGGYVGTQNKAGGLPTNNFNSGIFEGWEKLDGITLYKTLLRGRGQDNQDRKGRDTCFGCMVRCKRVVEQTKGTYKLDPLYGGPEYETLAGFGSYCRVDDLTAVCKANEICNRYGLDTITGGATIAWAMEMFEARQLTLAETDGLDLSFGNAESMVALVEKIASRDGFWYLLAQGSVRKEYHRQRGWDGATGLPTAETLAALGIGWTGFWRLPQLSLTV